tara:strand:- start:5204 stop:7402 length:2199 start_codon:yes stop_codon:yes gene_type:complete
MKKIILSIIILFKIFNIYAQNIEGKVLEMSDKKNPEPIIGANVYWEGTNVGVATDNEGYYSISPPPSLPATLNVSFVGYTLSEKKIINDQYIFFLKNSIALKEIEIKEKTNATSFSTISTINSQKLSEKEFQKAACCNVSESFLTSNTVDIGSSDAISGAKKIKMLGLDGIYTQITQENIPLIKGLSYAYGLEYVPGVWVESIQVIKGTGSVVNGFDALTGQINLEYHKPFSANKLYLNSYANSDGKIENNLLFAKKEGKWTSNLFTHITYFDNEIDKHGGQHDGNHETIAGDGFLDMPKQKQFGVLNRWKYKDEGNIMGQIVLKGLKDNKEGGQLKAIPNPFTFNLDNNIIELFVKTGIISKSNPNNSIGIQTSFKSHNQKANIGKNIYNGLEESAYLNIIHQRNIKKTDNILKYGFSYYASRYQESLNKNNYNRTDLISGLFCEYTYNADKIFSLILGGRLDYHNKHGLDYIPRINFKYNFSENSILRGSLGKAFRITNIFSENISYLASKREIVIQEELMPEVGWNYGLNYMLNFDLYDRKGSFNIDAYQTIFKNQVIVDIENPDSMNIYNLTGKSYANTIQADILYGISKKIDLRSSYKINNVYSTYNNIEKEVPLTPKNRALINISYTSDKNWLFDATCNYIGESRIPEHELITNSYSNPYYIYNAQITKKFTKLELYIGGENLTNYTQENPILDVMENEIGDNFDAALIWAPIMGRMIYGGLRYKY